MRNSKKSVKAGPKRKGTATSPRILFGARTVRAFIVMILEKASPERFLISQEELLEILQPIERMRPFSVLSSTAEMYSRQYQTLLRTSMLDISTMETKAKKDLEGLLKAFRFILLDFVQKGYFRPTQILRAVTLTAFCQIALNELQKEQQNKIPEQTAVQVFKLLATLPQARRDLLLDYMNPLDA